MNTRAMGSSSRLARRLLVFVWAALLVGATGAKADPVKTLVQDTLYRADGSAAQGNLTIRWNGFSTSAGEAVAAGEMTVATDAAGGVSIPLIPNTGSTPSGTYYKVMIKLNDGTISEEQWVVPVAGSTTIAAIRAKVVPQAVAAQFVSLDYLNSALSKISTAMPAPQINTDWNSSSGLSQLLNKPVLAAVASSGNYNDLSNTPVIPNLSAPGSIGAVTPGIINGAGYQVNGTALASSHLSDSGNLVRNTSSYANPAWLTGVDGAKITGALNNVPIGATTPNMINATNVTAQNVVTSQTPAVDIRAFGAVIDSTTPIDTALQAAINSAANTTGEVLLPCVGGCYLQNASALTSPGTTTLKLQLQGNLKLGSTFVTPDRTDLVCDGGAASAQFQMSGATCQITAPPVYGAMGTAITTTNAPVTFTPTFVGGTIANMPVNSAITIAGTTACSITSITRTAATWANVTATLSSACRIPAGTTVTVAGVTDTSFNTTPVVTASDYPALSLTWTQAGSVGTSSGGTVTGFNEDSFESVRITAVSGATVTAAFAHLHSASDVWGMVSIAPAYSTFNHHGFENINVWGAYGAGFWGEHLAFVSLKNMAFGEQHYMASIPVEMDSSWWFSIERSSLMPTLAHSCTNNCGQQGYPYGLRLTALETTRNVNNDSAGGEMSFIGDNTTISGGIKIDTNGLGQREGGLKISDTTIEQPVNNAVTIDPRYAAPPILPITLNNVFLQDSFMGYNFAYINYTDKTQGPVGSVNIQGLSTVLTGNVAGKYYTGRVLINGSDYYYGLIQLPVGRTVPPGTISDGSITKTELDGIGAAMGPSLIPFATQPVTTDPTLWGSCGTGCTVTSVLAPDGTMTAGEIDSGSSGNSKVTAYVLNTATSVGDRILYGAWVRPGANNNFASGAWGPMNLTSNAVTDMFDNAGNTVGPLAYQMNVAGDWWHPIAAMTTLTAATATSHNITLSLYGGSASGQGNQFYMPFLIYIPASAGIPLDEVERIRQELLHGVVPPGMPAGGAVLAMNAKHKLYWGSDTNLYRGAAGVVQTDGSFNVASGQSYQVGGSQITTSALGDWTNSGAATGYVATWNGSKWAPAATSVNLASPGPIGATAPGTMNATAYSVNGSALNFSNLAGMVTAAQLIAPTASSIGGVKSVDCSTSGSSYFVQKINTDGSETCVTISGAGTGNVTGPGSSTSGHLASFNSTNGQTIQDSGIASSAVRTTAGGATITAADTLSGMASGCTQLPCEVAKVAPTLYSGAVGVGTTTLYTTVAAGLFRVCTYADITVAGTAGTFGINFNYTTDGHGGQTNSPVVGVTTQWNSSTGCYNFYVDAAHGITWNLYPNGVTGTPTVRYAMTLEQLQ